MDETKGRLDSIEQKMADHAHKYIENGKKYTDMDNKGRDDLFDDSVVEFHKSVELMHKKFKLLETKVKDMEDLK